MKFFDGGRCGPVLDRLNLPLVHLDAVFTDCEHCVAEELNGWLMERTFLGLEEELMFSEAFEDLRHVMAMFGQVYRVDFIMDLVGPLLEMELAAEGLGDEVPS